MNEILFQLSELIQDDSNWSTCMIDYIIIVEVIMVILAVIQLILIGYITVLKQWIH